MAQVQRRHTLSNGYLVVAAMARVCLEALTLVRLQTMRGPQMNQLPNPEIKTPLEQGRVEQVLISDTLIRGVLKADQDGQPKNFVTVRVPDDQLVSQLQVKGVLYEG